MDHFGFKKGPHTLWNLQGAKRDPEVPMGEAKVPTGEAKVPMGEARGGSVEPQYGPKGSPTGALEIKKGPRRRYLGRKE